MPGRVKGNDLDASREGALCSGRTAPYSNADELNDFSEVNVRYMRQTA
jgi:hypothetical protein